MNVVLVGMMGAGKSTVGRALSRRNGWDLVDTDREIERGAGRTVPELFAEVGEPAFRDLESAALASAVGAQGTSVVSVGGGAVLAEGNRRTLRDSTALVVWLRASAHVIGLRVGDGRTRPILRDDPRGTVARLLPERDPLYAEVADLVVDVDGVAVDAVCERIEAAVAERGAP